MDRHYLSRKMRNAPTSIALCGYQFTLEELDWSQKAPTYSFFPNRVTCHSCRTLIGELVPQEHWEQRVEIYEPSHGQGRRYTAFYPDHMVRSCGTVPETTVLSRMPNNLYPPGTPNNPDLPYLDFQNVYDIMKLLARTARDPWREPISCLSPETAPLLHQAAKRLERTAYNEVNPELRKEFRLAAEQLNSIHAGIKARKQGNLTPAQADAFNSVWNSLEAIRCDKALSLSDTLAPFIDDNAVPEPIPDKSYAATFRS